MNIVIVGAGKVGELLIKELSEQNYHVLIIEKNKAIFERMIAHHDVSGIYGEGEDYEVLSQVVDEETDIFISVTASDEINILSAIMARNKGAKHTISRVRNLKYTNHLPEIFNPLGVDIMITPEKEAARDIYKTFKYPNALSVESFVGDQIRMVEYRVGEDNLLENLVLKDLPKISKVSEDIIIPLIKRGSNLLVPDGNFQIQREDLVHIIGTRESLKEFTKEIQGKQKKIESIFIVGGSLITFYLLEFLEDDYKEVKVIEKNLERAEQLAYLFPKVEVICDDGTSPGVLKNQRLGNYDAFVILTDIDEENIIMSLYAEKLGIQDTVTKVSRTELIHIIGEEDLRTIVTPKYLASNEIIKKIRSIISEDQYHIEEYYQLLGDELEAIEFHLTEELEIFDIALMNLHIKEGVILPFIYRNGEVIIPYGKDVLRKDDRVLVLSLEKNLNHITDILK